MQIAALHITGTDEKIQSKSIYLPCSRAQDLQNVLDRAKATGFIISDESADQILKLTDLIRKVGTKPRGGNKGLKYYLQLKRADTGHVVFIETKYASTKTTLNGVKKALKWVVDNEKERIFMISIPHDQFAQLHKAEVSPVPHAAAECPESLTEEAPAEAKATTQPREASLPTDLDVDEIGEDWIDNELQKQCEKIDKDGEKLNAAKKKFVGSTAEARRVRRLALLAAMDKDKTVVLLLGETGTGKEVVARLIHDLGSWKNRKFIPVNCGGIPSELLESELFGYERGAFTGAVPNKNKKGLWEIAGNGTLFLDEIGDLRLEHQEKILRPLAENEIQRVGGTELIKVNARVIAATNRDLFSMVKTGQFMEDLYYRLCGLLIRTPSLRNHPEDIPVLAQHLWSRLGGQKELPQEILNALQGHAWLGNARQLIQVLAALKTNFGRIPDLGAKHLKATFQLLEQKSNVTLGPVTDKDIDLERALCLRHLKQVRQALHACRHLATGLESNAQNDPTQQQRLLMQLKMHIDELKNLCSAPGHRFHNRKVAKRVVQLYGKLANFFKQVSQDYSQSRTLLEMLQGDVKLVLEKIEQEIERLIA